MADRLRSDRPPFLSAPVADWLLPAPFSDVFVQNDEMADWVRSKARRAILERGCPHPQTAMQGLPLPSRGLAELASLTPPPPPVHRNEKGEGLPRTAIDLGCGSGRDALWLKNQGWVVLGVDRLPPQADIPFFHANLHEFQTDQRFDLVMLHYCWDPEYLKLAMRLCAIGGRISILAHSETHWRCFGHPRRSKAFSESEFVNVLFPGLRKMKTQRASDFAVIESEEFWSLDRHSVWIVLERRK